MQNPSHKSIYSIYKSSSTLHKKTGKIRFTFLWFFCEFIRNLQVIGKSQVKERIFLHSGPWKQITLHNHALRSNNQALESKTLTNMPPAAEVLIPVAYLFGGDEV
jgi:hypothetical protein